MSYIYDENVLYKITPDAIEINAREYNDYLVHGAHKYISRKMVSGKWRYYYKPPAKKGKDGTTVYADSKSGVTTTAYKGGYNEADWDDKKVKKLSYNERSDSNGNTRSSLVTKNVATGKTYVTKTLVDKNGKFSIKSKDITIDTPVEKFLDGVLKKTTKKGLNYFRSL